MDIILLAITVVSLVVAFVMSVAAWRVTRDEKKRAAARVAALSLSASADDGTVTPQSVADAAALGHDDWSRPESFAAHKAIPSPVAPAMRKPWASSRLVSPPTVAPPAELPLNQTPQSEPERLSDPVVLSHASGFLGTGETPREAGGRQRTLAFAALILFATLSAGLAWMMSEPRGTSATALGPNSPLELVSLSHQRDDGKLAVSGLVRNPAAGEPIQKLSAVVFLFDRAGAFVTSARANVDFLKLAAGDESPFVVSLDAPATVARYRVSFRTDDGVVPHIDRRGATVAPADDEQAVNVKLK